MNILAPTERLPWSEQDNLLIFYYSFMLINFLWIKNSAFQSTQNWESGSGMKPSIIGKGYLHHLNNELVFLDILSHMIFIFSFKF